MTIDLAVLKVPNNKLSIYASFFVKK